MATKKSTSAEANVAVSAPPDMPLEMPPESEQGGAGDPTGTAQRSDHVLARVRSIGGPRRRAGISFTSDPVTLRLSDFDFDQAKAEGAFKEIMADSRLSVLPPE